MSETIAPPPVFNRWIPVIAGIAIQLTLGTAYIWGVFQAPVMKALNCNNATAALTFSFLLGVLTIGSTIGGMVQDRLTPRPVIIGGGIILALGFILASFTTKDAPQMIWLSYGVLGGFGMGTVYTTTIATCQKWFPDKRGFITGLIVSALGFGGLVFTPIAQMWITQSGVMRTFFFFGIVFLVVCSIGAFFINNPAAGYIPAGWTPPAPKAGALHGQDFTPGEVLRTPQFYLVITALMLATAAGMMIIPFAKVLGLARGLTPQIATTGVMVIAIFNSFGRLFWGWMSDKLGRKTTLIILTLLAGTSILFVDSSQSYMLLVYIGLVAFSYGGFLGTFPALTADYWGVKNMGMNYGMVLLGFGIGAVASSFVVGYLKDLTNSFTMAFYIASIAAFVGCILTLMLNPPVKQVKAVEVETME